LASNDYIKANGSSEDMKDNAWFVGFAPRDNPEIVVVTLFEHGGLSALSAAIVRDVLKAHFDKKDRVTQWQQNQSRTVAALGLGLPGTGPPR
jgi:penicillin-binding protein 2